MANLAGGVLASYKAVHVPRPFLTLLSRVSLKYLFRLWRKGCRLDPPKVLMSQAWAANFCLSCWDQFLSPGKQQVHVLGDGLGKEVGASSTVPCEILASSF